MKVEETYIKGCFVIKPKAIEDERGVFFESFNQKLFKELTSVSVNFVQDNQSISSKGVLRGLHFQTGKNAQAKLVRVIKGKVLDICVDLRRESKTFGKHFSIVLDDIDNKQLFIPRGFAHGFLVLKNDTIFAYKCDNYYDKSSEEGILYYDPIIDIDWGYPQKKLIISDKDKKLSSFETLFK